MPTTCGFPNCKFRSRYRGCEDNRHFYRVPKKPLVLRNRWLEAIGRTEETIVSQLRVCSGHFHGGEKKEGDIPVADPTIDPPLKIELPPKTVRSSQGSSYRASMKVGTDNQPVRSMHGNSSYMRARSVALKHQISNFSPPFQGKNFPNFHLSSREQQITMNYMKQHNQELNVPTSPSSSIKPFGENDNTGCMKNRYQLIFEQLQHMRSKMNNGVPLNNLFGGNHPLFQALLKQSGLTTNGPERSENFNWQNNSTEQLEFKEELMSKNGFTPENILEKLRMNALMLISRQQNLPNNLMSPQQQLGHQNLHPESATHTAGGKRSWSETIQENNRETAFDFLREHKLLVFGGLHLNHLHELHSSIFVQDVTDLENMETNECFGITTLVWGDILFIPDQSIIKRIINLLPDLQNVIVILADRSSMIPWKTLDKEVNTIPLSLHLESSLRADWILQSILAFDQSVWEQLSINNRFENKEGNHNRIMEDLQNISLQNSRICGIIGIEPTSLSLLMRLKSCGYQTMLLAAQITPGLDKTIQGTIRANDINSMLGVCDHLIIFDFKLSSNYTTSKQFCIDEEFLRHSKFGSNLFILARNTAQFLNYETLKDALNSNLMKSITLVDSDLWYSVKKNQDSAFVWQDLMNISTETRINILPNTIGFNRTNIERIQNDLRKILIEISRNRESLTPKAKSDFDKVEMHGNSTGNVHSRPPFSIESMCKNKTDEMVINLRPEQEEIQEVNVKSFGSNTLEIWCEILKRARENKSNTLGYENTWTPPEVRDNQRIKVDDSVDSVEGEQEIMLERAESTASSTAAPSGSSSLTSAYPLANRSLPVNGI